MKSLSRNAQLAVLRFWAHDRVCTEGAECGTRSDHARRTQHDFARQFLAGNRDGRVDALHRSACMPAVRGDCAHREQHEGIVAAKWLPLVEAALEEKP